MPPRWITPVVVVLIVGVLAVDLLTPLGYAVPLLYLVPLLLTFGEPRLQPSLAVAGACTILTVIRGVAFPTGYFWPGVTNRGMVILVLWLAMFARAIHVRAISARRDVADQQRAVERLQRFLDATPIALVAVNPGGEIIMANSQTERLFGYAREELIGQPVERLVPERYRSRHEEYRRNYMATPEPRPMGAGRDLYALRKDGSEFPAEVALSAVEIQDGMVVLAGIVDLSFRKEMQRMLEENQSRLQLAQRAALAGEWEWDIRTGQASWSEEYALLHGFDRSVKPSYESWLGSIHPEDRASVDTAVRQAVEERREVDIEFRITRPNGEVRWLNFRGQILCDDLGQPVRLIGFTLDVTAHKALEEEVRQMQKMEALGRLAAGIAHDFNNVLTVINGFSELLLRQVELASPQYKPLQMIKHAGEQAAALTQQILAAGRKQLLHPIVLDMNAVMTEMEPVLRRLLGAAIEVVCLPAPSPALVEVDRGQLTQIVMNLAFNARDAMPQGGRLTIETSHVDSEVVRLPSLRPGPYVSLSVCDTGQGMDEATKARIFDPFFTTKKNETVGKGTGLGLATVHGIVMQSGGAITVDSEREHGTMFTIFFPRMQASSDSAGATEPSLLAPRGAATVLLVDDEQAIRAMVRQGIEEIGCHVLEAATGDAALDMARQHHGPIHLLLTDVVMPGMKGTELADCLRLLRPNLKVLYMSGYTEDMIGTRGVSYPRTAFLKKPFALADLTSKVREVLDATGKE